VENDLQLRGSYESSPPCTPRDTPFVTLMYIHVDPISMYTYISSLLAYTPQYPLCYSYMYIHVDPISMYTYISSLLAYTPQYPPCYSYMYIPVNHMYITIYIYLIIIYRYIFRYVRYSPTPQHSLCSANICNGYLCMYVYTHRFVTRLHSATHPFLLF